jgi:glycosyltransferase involved in cell wall biosynthesis
MIRILLVPSSDYLGHPFPQRHNQIFERLHDGKNFEVHVVRFRLFEKQKLETRLIVHELGETKTGPMAAYYLMKMINHATEIRRIIRQESIDLVVLSNIAAPLAYVLMDELSSMHVPVIFDLPDYYPTSAAGYIFDVKSTNGKLLSGTFDFMLRYIIKRATAVTAASSSLVEYAKIAGARHAKQVPNGISDAFLKLHCGHDLREKMGIGEEEIVIGYVGSLEFWLDMKNLIKGLSLARQKGLSIKLLMIGKSLHTDYPKKVIRWLESEELEKHTLWLDFIPYNEVPSYIASFNIGTIPFNTLNPTAYYAAPNKMWEYFSQMKPVISAPIPEALNNNDCVLTATSPQEYLQKIMFVTEKENASAFKVRNGYNKALKNTWTNSMRNFESIICQILNQKTSIIPAKYPKKVE